MITKKKVSLFYELTLFTLALISVIFLWSRDPIILLLDQIVWVIFFLDVLIRLIFTKKRWKYIKEHPFDIIAAIPLDNIFQVARVARLFRLLRAVAVSKKFFPTFFNILRTNGLDRLLGATLVLLFISTILIKQFEPSIHTYADGLWWSLVTTTTVGYGDISPVSPVGRIIAVILMIIGIGLIVMITGSITTFFVKNNKFKNPTVEFIQNELDRYDELSQNDVKRLNYLLEELAKEKSDTKSVSKYSTSRL
ncbi:voltage-gated potassium channel [Thalassobacillus cyri]|uniref:Voltage-gated potassium channel n=1 Tax=Thalassobacillus cyri TaxID=571932 RepID=A0A1H4BY51_9BACI|nr:potassium channel family protein [Thalassobacillus cyri]SEA52762.1 voltage-gated potassium channel [Thalassobacillus cyri]